ncbi:hypothetical protein Trydic_g14476 [Trypoxylus dichotomus]
MIRSTEMSTLRMMIAGKTKGDRVRNKDIREECGIEDVVIFARERRRRWNDRVQKAEESRLTRIARYQRLMGTRWERGPEEH